MAFGASFFVWVVLNSGWVRLTIHSPTAKQKFLTASWNNNCVPMCIISRLNGFVSFLSLNGHIIQPYIPAPTSPLLKLFMENLPQHSLSTYKGDLPLMLWIAYWVPGPQFTRPCNAACTRPRRLWKLWQTSIAAMLTLQLEIGCMSAFAFIIRPPRVLTRNWWTGGLVFAPPKRLRNSSWGNKSSPSNERWKQMN